MGRFSEIVRETRQLKGWTQEEMARKVGVSLSTVQRWERRGAKPNRLAASALSRLFRRAGVENPFDGPPAAGPAAQD
jgi:transcriptional regulator with XRE-family HTH domain